MKKRRTALSDSAYLTTHVLDVSRGVPAAGISVTLWRLGASREKVAEAVTNADGRCDAPLVAGDAFRPGPYELVFMAGSYFDAAGIDLPDPKFLDEVVIRFGVAEATHYHVPLLLSPFGYSTYRGS
ncbi:hydroxyisourate hydrolase [Consotaella aegiceratis]|uniref:hydroxyisourate hydrolase n=1 Tax=Consotaella aegiceratis TaxID=3097961 RepID=UPI002F3FB189